MMSVRTGPHGLPRILGWGAAMAGALAILTASPALAARPSHGGGGGGGGSSSTTGNDVSYPQCGGSLPSGQAFGIVGVSDGLANTPNPCLGPSPSYPSYTESELYWAFATSIGGTAQPPASLYVNTADPGDSYNGSVISDWPTSGSTPYGSCTTTTVTLSSGTYSVGANSDACAWQYGYNKATQDASWLAAAASAINAQESSTTVPGMASRFPWWLDVETGNTWQSDTTMNVADLQGMIAGLQAAGAGSVGVYSTTAQWDSITGSTTNASGALWDIPEWVAGARTASEAQGNCTQTSFTGGVVSLAQWSGRPFDGDVVCP